MNKDEMKLVEAIKRNDVALVCRLVTPSLFGFRQAAVDLNSSLGFSDKRPLWVAVAEGKKEIVEFLIAKGANVNAANEEGATPLWKAAQMGQKEIVELLIAKGATVNAASEDGLMPLTKAAPPASSSPTTEEPSQMLRTFSVVQKGTTLSRKLGIIGLLFFAALLLTVGVRDCLYWQRDTRIGKPGFRRQAERFVTEHQLIEKAMADRNVREPTDIGGRFAEWVFGDDISTLCSGGTTPIGGCRRTGYDSYGDYGPSYTSSGPRALRWEDAKVIALVECRRAGKETHDFYRVRVQGDMVTQRSVFPAKQVEVQVYQGNCWIIDGETATILGYKEFSPKEVSMDSAGPGEIAMSKEDIAYRAVWAAGYWAEGQVSEKFLKIRPRR